MFQINDYRTNRLLVDDHNNTYRPLPRRSLRRATRRAAQDGRRRS
jgi:hypothetical protein